MIYFAVSVEKESTLAFSKCNKKSGCIPETQFSQLINEPLLHIKRVEQSYCRCIVEPVEEYQQGNELIQIKNRDPPPFEKNFL